MIAPLRALILALAMNPEVRTKVAEVALTHGPAVIDRLLDMAATKIAEREIALIESERAEGLDPFAEIKHKPN